MPKIDDLIARRTEPITERNLSWLKGKLKSPVPAEYAELALEYGRFDFKENVRFADASLSRPRFFLGPDNAWKRLGAYTAPPRVNMLPIIGCEVDAAVYIGVRGDADVALVYWEHGKTKEPIEVGATLSAVFAGFELD